ncbi:MAG: flagellar biosynthetic protein FliR, partial [Treponema sp.]|nr:flagellar biosynthetic protein FliR [Treponema sp.]
FVNFFVKSLSNLFADALVIALPVMASLFLVSLCMGLLSKAAPQMNLLAEGFAIMLPVSFLVIIAFIPSLCDFFVRSFDTGLSSLIKLMQG